MDRIGETENNFFIFAILDTLEVSYPKYILTNSLTYHSEVGVANKYWSVLCETAQQLTCKNNVSCLKTRID